MNQGTFSDYHLVDTSEIHNMLAGWHWGANDRKCGIYVFGSSKYNEYYFTVCSRLSKN